MTGVEASGTVTVVVRCWIHVATEGANWTGVKVTVQGSPRQGGIEGVLDAPGDEMPGGMDLAKSTTTVEPLGATTSAKIAVTDGVPDTTDS